MPLLSLHPVRARHSMTNLYETLGVKRDSEEEEIEAAYQRLYNLFDLTDPTQKVVFDDI